MKQSASLPVHLVSICLLLLLASSCKRPTDSTPTQETSMVTDREGNVYRTVKIGTQWWMAENLKVRSFLNGDPIRIARDTTSWKKDSAACCLFDDDTLHAPGLLYNWYAVNDSRNLCPPGWHVPSDDEWKVLETSLGMSGTDTDNINWRGTHEGEKLKIASPADWDPFGSVWSTNTSGFTARAGGCRMFTGEWGVPGLHDVGFWWTSSENTEKHQGWYRYLDYKNANVFRFYGPKTYGFSIRCVADSH